MKATAYKRKLETEISWAQHELDEIRGNPAYQRHVSTLSAKLKGLRRAHGRIKEKVPSSTAVPTGR